MRALILLQLELPSDYTAARRGHPARFAPRSCVNLIEHRVLEVFVARLTGLVDRASFEVILVVDLAAERRRDEQRINPVLVSIATRLNDVPRVRRRVGP